MPDKKDKRKEVLILGMHRSGTSMVGGLIERMGFYFGKPEKVGSGSTFNLLGHYENLDMVDVNDDILSFAGGSWDCPPEIEKHFKYPEEYQKKAERLVGKLRSESQMIAFKDPRVSLLLDFWEPFLNRAKFIFIFRDPISVAQSLHKRDSFSIEKGIALWKVYNENILDYINKYSLDALYLSYEQVLSNSVASIFQISKFLDLELSKVDIICLASIIIPKIDHSVKISLKDYRNSKIFSESDKLYQTLKSKIRSIDGRSIDKESEKAISYFRKIISDVEIMLKNAQQHSDILEQEREDLLKKIDEKESLIKDKDRRLDAILNSKSWKIMEFLRKIKR